MRLKNIRVTVQLILITSFLSFFVSCTSDSVEVNNPIETDNAATVILLHTNDEHGWMETTETASGAAGIMGLWKANENYSAAGSFLVLSGGDNWTGPAISTWFDGQSMVEVMNEMNYTATAIGNHEFDYTISTLEQRESESNYPYLSANIRYKGTNNIPGFATPYLIKKISGITFGIIGLTTITTPSSAFPENVKDFDFISYKDALNQFVPEMKSKGAEFIIVDGHICVSEMQAISITAKNLGISIMTGGHCHEQYSGVSNDVLLIESGSAMKGYSRVEIKYDTLENTTLSVIPSYVENVSSDIDPGVKSIVDKWKTEADKVLSEVIGYASDEIPVYSSAMFNLIADSWLYTFPNADISISNKGGVRQSIPAGQITIGTVVGILPFDNDIYELKLTGDQLINSLNPSLFTGGMTRAGGYYLSDGTEINSSATYSVLITDYMYQSYPDFGNYDPSPYMTNVNFRQPLIDYLKSLKTTSANPLNNFLDTVSRE